MKKMFFLSSVSCAALFLSPLLLTGCQGTGGMFDGSSPYRGQQTYTNPDSAAHHHDGRAGGHSNSAHSSTNSPAHRAVHRGNAASVPVEHPTVHNMNSSTATSASSNQGPARKVINNNAVTVPAAPTSAPIAAPNMVAPTVGQ